VANLFSVLLGMVVLAGFASGAFMGASFQLEDARPDALLTSVLAAVCGSMTNHDVAATCAMNVRVVSLMLSAVSFLAVVESVPRTGDWRVGMVLYAASMVIGLLAVAV
jgi:hypothetical protein